tara:strand:- start:337 stop:579 length:243 start_codon:yes stop_codon:yes gene_type:complete
MTKRAPQKLKSWRTALDLTQAAAGELFGVTRQQWNRWENGLETPGAAYMIELHREGVCSPNDFFALPEWASGRLCRRDAA